MGRGGAWPSAIAQLQRITTCNMANVGIRNKIPPGERWAVVPYDSPAIARALLLFDKIFCPDWDEDTKWNREICYLNSVKRFDDLYYTNPDDSRESLSAINVAGFVNWDFNLYDGPIYLRNAFVEGATRSLERQGYFAIPFYLDLSWDWTKMYSDDGYASYEAALTSLPVVKLNNVDLQHVRDFRRDTEATRKFRDLRLWLEESLKAESVHQATEIIAQKIDDYEWALHKHGFETDLGTFKQVLDWKHASLYGSAAAAGGYLYGPLGAAIAGGLFISAQVVATVLEKKVSLSDARRGQNREVAVLYDIRRKFGDQKCT